MIVKIVFDQIFQVTKLRDTEFILIAICSRLFMIILQCLSNLIIPDHDAKVFRYLRTETEENYFYSFLNYTLSGFIRWDAEYFMHIAKYGYTFENTLAFFPLYPFLVKTITTLCSPLFYGATVDTALLTVFILLNIVFMTLSVKVLYKLTNLFFDPEIAYRTSVLFLFNPASIFFSAPYTECLFSYLTFESIYRCALILRKYSKPSQNFHWKDASVLFFIAASTAVRSNGLLNIGFLSYTILCIYFTYFPKNETDRIKYILKYFFILLSSCIICMMPFVYFQFFCYKQFCTDFTVKMPVEIIKYASDKQFILPGHFSTYNQSWCYSKLPLAYSYIQDHYWNVGFLKYYEFKQIPNFLLAFPCLFIVIKNCILHIKLNAKNVSNIFNLKEIVVKTTNTNYTDQFFNFGVSVFVIHALFLSVFCALCIHVQVSTRMICSATPLFYWYCTYYWMNGRKRITKFYFDSYLFVGTVMFCNFLPWT